MKVYFFSIIYLFVFSFCSSPKKSVENTSEKQSKSEKTVTAPIVEKHFYNKIGEKMEQTEYYIQQSVQDYFIKFCESKVTREELESALAKIESPIKTLTLKIEIRDGEWDRCENYPVQSRIGAYAVILEIK